MQPAPDTTASTGHFVSGPLGGPAAPAAPASSTTASAVATPLEKMCRMTLSCGLTRAAEADDDAERERRRPGGADRERASKRTALDGESAAAQQRTGKVRCRARPSEAHLVIAEAGPARAAR